MPGLQEALFGIFAVIVVALVAFHLKVGVLALLGASACGGVYLFTGMIPSRTDSFCNRAFTSTFLASVLSCVVLIVPATLGLRPPPPSLERATIDIAIALPAAAFCIEVMRSPGLIRRILRLLGQ